MMPARAWRERRSGLRRLFRVDGTVEPVRLGLYF